MITPKTFRLIVGAVVTGLLIALLVITYKSWKSGQDAKDGLEQAQRTDRATTGIVDDINTGTTDTQRVEVIVSDARSTYQRGYEDAKREDPAVADLSRTPIPQRLRDLARHRREARERLGCAGPGCEGDAAGQGTRR